LNLWLIHEQELFSARAKITCGRCFVILRSAWGLNPRPCSKCSCLVRLRGGISSFLWAFTREQDPGASNVFVIFITFVVVVVVVGRSSHKIVQRTGFLAGYSVMFS
jgi:hypothetical protein